MKAIDNTPPKEARICRDCTNLVTTDAKCPLCDAPTEPHPNANTKEEYCIACAKGPFPAETMHLVTWNEGPYSQIEDGDLMCICPNCRVEMGEEI